MTSFRSRKKIKLLLIVHLALWKLDFWSMWKLIFWCPPAVSLHRIRCCSDKKYVVGENKEDKRVMELAIVIVAPYGDTCIQIYSDVMQNRILILNQYWLRWLDLSISESVIRKNLRWITKICSKLATSVKIYSHRILDYYSYSHYVITLLYIAVWFN